MPRKKKIEVEQLSLFGNPSGPTVAQFKDQLVAEFRAQKGAYLQEARKKRKRNRADSIFLPEDQRVYQDSFLVQPVYPYPEWCFPQVSTKPEDVKGLIRQAALTAGAGVPNVRLGLDFEFNPDKHKISIIGVANATLAAACRWDDSFLPLLYAAIDVGVVFVGHWVLGADKFELENAARESGLAEILARKDGYLTPRSAWLDSMGLHYLCNQALCKAPGKEADEDGSLGYMGIGSALFLSSEIPGGYKHCRGTGCTGPCPKCRVFDYCAVDAFSGLVIAENYLRVMQQKSIPFSCYEKWAELTLDVCLRAESRGLLVNKPFLDGFDKELEKTKAELFPHENSAYKYFNPQSGKQIIDYFADRGVPLRDSHGKASSTKNVILGALERELTKYGFRDVAEFEGSDDQVVLSEVDELLYKLFLYKDTGKDSTAWFNQEKKFLVQHDGAWWIHPRFSTTGASTTRLSSSRPNFQNFKKRGLGAAIRKAIIPRPGCIMCANDAKQLEFRIVSYEAGIEVPGYDFFDWLVGRANGQFEKAAETMHAKARDIAKRVNHACVTGEHEILTPAGWERIDNYAGQDIAVFSEDGTLRFEKPLRYFAYPESGDRIDISGACLNTSVTENHKFPVNSIGNWKGKKYSKWSRRTVAELPSWGNIPTGGVLVDSGTEVYSDDDIRRAVAVQADGCLTGNRIRFHVTKPRKKDRLEKLFESKCIKCYCKNHEGFILYTKFRSPLFDEKRRFTAELLKLSARQREIFLEELMFWDGHVNRKGRQEYSNSCVTSCQWVQTMAHLSNKQGLMRQCPWDSGYGRTKMGYKVSINNRKLASVESLSFSKTSESVPVYCFETSTGAFLVRYRNSIHVTGNSAYGEGFKLFDEWQLATKRTHQQVVDGSLRIFDDWIMDGKIVGFTGANLAQTLFGDKTDISRRKALNLQFDVWLRAVPEIHPWHRKMSKIAERGWAQLRTGHYLELLGSPSDNFKAGCAYYGQGGGSQFMQDKMIMCARMESNYPMCAQIHDDLMWDNLPLSWATDKIKRFVAHLSNEETPSFPGLLVPFDTQIGPNWGEMRSI